MGTLGDGNGGGWPPEGGGPPDDLPDLPPEWGTIIIPDDPGALAEEAAQVRRELRRTDRIRRWRRRLHLPSRRRDGEGSPMGVPLMIITIAVLATMVSLFAIAWPGHTREPQVRTPAETEPSPAVLPDVTVVDSTGSPLRLRDTAPAVILLVDGCACDALVSDTAAAATAVDPTVGVVIVAHAKPVPAPPPGPRRWAATDPNGALRSALPSLPSGTGKASALLVDATGTLVAVLATATSVDDFRADLTKLRR